MPERHALAHHDRMFKRALARSSLALLALILISTAACGPFIGDNDFDPEQYAGMVEEAQEDGLTVYWLGREFEAGGLVLDEIDPSLFHDDTGRVTSIELHYVPHDREEPEPLNGTLDVNSLTPRPAVEVAAKIGQPPEQFARVDRTSVTVDGVAAEMVTIWLRSLDEPTSRYVVLEFPGATVLVSTSIVRGENEPNINPLMDEALFLSVAERLEPYSQ